MPIPSPTRPAPVAPSALSGGTLLLICAALLLSGCDPKGEGTLPTRPSAAAAADATVVTLSAPAAGLMGAGFLRSGARPAPLVAPVSLAPLDAPVSLASLASPRGGATPSVSAVPEPAPYLCLALGGLGVALLLLRAHGRKQRDSMGVRTS